VAAGYNTTCELHATHEPLVAEPWFKGIVYYALHLLFSYCQITEKRVTWARLKRISSHDFEFGYPWRITTEMKLYFESGRAVKYQIPEWKVDGVYLNCCNDVFPFSLSPAPFLTISTRTPSFSCVFISATPAVPHPDLLEIIHKGHKSPRIMDII
jgi:hypothetical protein